MKLLIADDSNPLRESLKSRLGDISGISEILEAKSLIETVRILEKNTPDILILDLQLGDGSGFDILARINAMKTDTRVIVFTSFSYPQYRQKALDLGAFAFVGKSDDDQLFDLLEKMIDPDGDHQTPLITHEADKCDPSC